MIDGLGMHWRNQIIDHGIGTLSLSRSSVSRFLLCFLSAAKEQEKQTSSNLANNLFACMDLSGGVYYITASYELLVLSRSGLINYSSIDGKKS